jgi:hypothetical protein
MDMSGQLESYEEQVERQQEALVDLTTRYEELESITVTSEQAGKVLRAIESLNEEESDYSKLWAIESLTEEERLTKQLGGS